MTRTRATLTNSPVKPKSRLLVTFRTLDSIDACREADYGAQTVSEGEIPAVVTYLAEQSDRHARHDLSPTFELTEPPFGPITFDRD